MPGLKIHMNPKSLYTVVRILASVSEMENKNEENALRNTSCLGNEEKYIDHNRISTKELFLQPV